ncbi:type 1 periplasmic-binding domain-containing protein [Bacillus solitudinis]|uniref:hypothetical protein n=1 Tax=Bacillus solitudinis TaxID=2014074 RepID=UPI0012FD40E0|nr:hypothetical protein [Bacillus solitudinis]
MGIRIEMEERAENHKIQLLKFIKGEYDNIPKDIDGIIVVGDTFEEQLELLKKITPNILVIDSYYVNDHCDALLIDFERVTRQILDHFIETGHQHIGFLGGVQTFSNNAPPIQEKREIFFRRYLEYIYTQIFTVNAGYQLMKEAISKLKDKLPTAIETK